MRSSTASRNRATRFPPRIDASTPAFLALADKKKEVFDEDLEALVGESERTINEVYHLEHAVFGFALLALGIGVTRFWRDVSPGRGSASAPAVAEAAKNALTLKYLDGGHGDGCNEESDRFTLARRRFHHFTFYGFMLCFAATSMATLYHYLLACMRRMR